MRTRRALGLVCLIALAGCRESYAKNRAPDAKSRDAALVDLPSFSALARQIMPSVVSLQVEQRQRPEDQRLDGFPFFQEPPDYQMRGIGSGFVIEPESGLILTNAHVVEDASTIRVTVTAADGSEKEMSAKVLGVAPEYDVALIKAQEPIKAPQVQLGDSDGLEIGDWVMAIGNPFGLTHSASVGIISAKRRRDVVPSGRQGLYDFLQTDASINPGNSGGPLLNLHGEVIGINAAVNAQGQGIGFAIPINIAKTVLPQLRTSGRFERSWIGVRIQSLTPELAQSFGLKEPKGVLVAEIVPKSPAAKAGLREGDVVLTFEGQPLLHAADLPLVAGMVGVGKKVKLGIWRSGKSQEVTLELAPAPRDEEQEEAVTGEPAPPEPEHLGLSITTLTPELHARLKTKAKHGALLTQVLPGGVAAEAGLRPGDIVYEVDGKEIAAAKDLVTAMEHAKRGQLLRLRVERENMHFFAALRRP